MSLDPNWFYSSLAQSAAGLVGLLGAVLAARLQEQYGRILETATVEMKLLEALRIHLDGKLAEAKQYIAFADKRIQDLAAAMAERLPTLTVSEELDLWRSSTSGGARACGATSEELQRYKKQRAFAQNVATHWSKGAILTTLADARTMRLGAEELLKQAADGVRAPLDYCIVLVVRAEEADRKHQNAASVRLPVAVVAVIAWLGLFGLVAPLYYLSAFDNASKYTLLITFSVGVMAIPFYIGYEIFRIVRLKTVVAELAT